MPLSLAGSGVRWRPPTRGPVAACRNGRMPVPVRESGTALPCKAGENVSSELRAQSKHRDARCPLSPTLHLFIS
eukprot:1189234-Prymnesium_polylepis.1